MATKVAAELLGTRRNPRVARNAMHPEGSTIAIDQPHGTVHHADTRMPIEHLVKPRRPRAGRAADDEIRKLHNF